MWIENILRAIIVFILTFGMKFLLDLINKNTTSRAEQEVLQNCFDLLEGCVLYTSQTYVEPLKNEGKWNETTAKTAKEICIKQFNSLLNEFSRKVLEKTYTNADNWVDSMLEAMVKANKK